MNSRAQSQQEMLMQLRLNFVKLIYQNLMKHVDRSIASATAKKQEQAMFEKYRTLAEYKRGYEAYLREHPPQDSSSSQSQLVPAAMGSVPGGAPQRSMGLDPRVSSSSAARTKLKLIQHINKFCAQLKEGYRIAQEFPMEYPNFQKYRNHIRAALRINPDTRTTLTIPELRSHYTNVKTLTERVMNNEVVEKMKTHYLALEGRRKQPQINLPTDDSFRAKRAALKEKVKKILPIRLYIIKSIEKAQNVAPAFKEPYSKIRRKIEQIVDFYERKCTTIENLHKCNEYVHATYREWKALTSRQPSGSAASAPSSVIRNTNTESEQYMAQLRHLFDFYRKMREFRRDTKTGDVDDEENFTDEVTEVYMLKDEFTRLYNKAKAEGLSIAQLPSALKQRIKHLVYSANVRKQLVLFEQLGTLESCAEKCAIATASEWFYQLQNPVNKLIAEIAQLQNSTHFPNPDTNRVFQAFWHFRNQLRDLKAQQNERTVPKSAPKSRKSTARSTKGKQSGKQSGNQSGKQAGKQGGKQGGKQSGKQGGKQTGKQTKSSAASKRNARKRSNAGPASSSDVSAMAAVGRQMGLGPPASTKSKQGAAARKRAEAAKRKAEATAASRAKKVKAESASAARKRRSEETPALKQAYATFAMQGGAAAATANMKRLQGSNAGRGKQKSSPGTKASRASAARGGSKQSTARLASNTKQRRLDVGGAKGAKSTSKTSTLSVKSATTTQQKKKAVQNAFNAVFLKGQQLHKTAGASKKSAASKKNSRPVSTIAATPVGTTANMGTVAVVPAPAPAGGAKMRATPAATAK